MKTIQISNQFSNNTTSIRVNPINGDVYNNGFTHHAIVSKSQIKKLQANRADKNLVIIRQKDGADAEGIISFSI